MQPPIGIFPFGIWQYILGGVLIGIATAGIFLFTGISAGVSTVFTSTLSWFSSRRFFNQKKYLDSRIWRIVFIAGIILGALAFQIGEGIGFTTQVQWWRLLVGGILVGIGTRMSNGCTSGHGICGISSFSRASFSAVITFLLVAIVTALAVRSIGVLP